MNKASLYAKCNGQSIRDNSYIINRFLKKMRWQPNERILDIGSGDGALTLNYLLPRLPNDIEQLIGSDISPEMVEHAQNLVKKWNIQKVSFQEFDASSDKLPNDFKEGFNHIFSFCCFQWIKDQKKVFQNLYRMLKPGGGFLVSYYATNPFMEVHDKMVKYSQWSHYMKNYEQLIPSSHYSRDPANDLKNLLEELGFDIHYCEAEKLSYDYPNILNLLQVIVATNPFVDNMTRIEVFDYCSELISELRKLDTVTVTVPNNRVDPIINFEYKLMVAHASKPFGSKS